MRHARTIVAAALLAAIVPAGAARAAGPTANPPGMTRLSDERTLSRWAYPNNHARVRSRPTGQARTVGTLHWLTEDNLPEIYLVLASWRDAHGNTWVKIRVPKRPNGVTGWVPRQRAAPVHDSRHLPGPQPLEPCRDALPRRQGGHVGARRHRLERQPHAARRLLRPREVPRHGRAGLRAFRAGHERLRPAPDRLARAAASSACTAPTSRASSPAARRTAASACATRRSVACIGSCPAARRSTSTTEASSARGAAAASGRATGRPGGGRRSPRSNGRPAASASPCPSARWCRSACR